MIRSIFLLACCLAFVATDANAQRKQLRKFHNNYRSVAETHRIGLSFLPLRIISWFIPGRAFEGEARDVKWALKKVRRVKIYTIDMDNGEAVSSDAIGKLKEDLYASYKFEPLMEIRSAEGSHVQFLSNGKTDDRLDNLLLLVQDEGEMVMVHLRTKLTMNDLQRITEKFKKEI
ncbi:DUF4252 domain-containing protein [Chitinophaga sp. SYP-B3965]|uniref:DUF4252 domain-containing protein n=1 Tax=Chitinophaga sp. SYP-B3965 TaxID=2663120 RepID=UPI001299CC94|nr:DUF4252 domain-containing protein [Chitinophaga sp. SYP-B3965]MRG44471.1 DUF4252 domain-containing protein [Chitinophaga sp. SYP-B3965]